ncbi:hypothetical protein [Succinivibrio dextrinosolvens]|uniref:Uncharacterized protein n=1 Tax=Succinivibrio dextrinosolvens TaxID=83771 RepID=A0A662ZDK2_9GAMM|nr:hypothetical protein [Succinivibrio dextrinosolvens]SFK60764.1 hypothetical protein SAMN04487865_11393 [Succinivibrio dextrinosolvens]
MTDMEHKPNGWNLPINQMTDDEWTDYFECRKKYDIKLSDKERKAISDEAHKYLKDRKKFIEISKKTPLFPELAIAAKACSGLKGLKGCNLSWAKKVYPDEF